MKSLKGICSINLRMVLIYPCFPKSLQEPGLLNANDFSVLYYDIFISLKWQKICHTAIKLKSHYSNSVGASHVSNITYLQDS